MALKSNFKSRKFRGKDEKYGEEYKPIFQDEDDTMEDEIHELETCKHLIITDGKKEECRQHLLKAKDDDQVDISQTKITKKQLRRTKSSENSNSNTKSSFMKMAANLFMRSSSVKEDENTDDSDDDSEKLPNQKK